MSGTREQCARTLNNIHMKLIHRMLTLVVGEANEDAGCSLKRMYILVLTLRQQTRVILKAFMRLQTRKSDTALRSVHNTPTNSEDPLLWPIVLSDVTNFLFP